VNKSNIASSDFPKGFTISRESFVFGQTCNMSSISVIIINYNTCEHLRECLQTVESEKPGEILVIDNASQDGSVAMVQSKFPRVKLIAGKKNLGYGAAANLGIACSTFEYVLLLNSDTRIQPGATQQLSDYLQQHAEAAIVGPRLIGTDERLQPSCFPFPSVFNTLLLHSSLGSIVRYVPFLKNFYLPGWSHDKAKVVPWVMGAALFIKRQAFREIGGFDESYFMYFEEVDLCYRLGKAGWETHFAPVATIAHVGGASTGQHLQEMKIQFHNSAIRFVTRYNRGIRLISILFLLKLIVLLRWLLDSLRLLVGRDLSQKALLMANTSAWKTILLKGRGETINEG
jgi:N-acetylglucosaminyl-diphospho-decaprenol L-rhamnosyltransferase